MIPAVAGHVALEHMLSGSLLTTLLAIITLAPPARTVRPVILACAEEEQHVLPVYALHAELAGQGVDVRQLGGRVPRQALAHAVSHPRPGRGVRVVPGTCDRAARTPGQPARRAADRDRRPRLAAAGPGSAAHLAGTLEEAAAELAGRAFASPG